MFTIFMEYQIEETMRSKYLEHIDIMKAQVAERGGHNYLLMEGIDQPNLFVEMCDVETEEAYQAIKVCRQSNEVLAACVAGGASKIHVWAFHDV